MMMLSISVRESDHIGAQILIKTGGDLSVGLWYSPKSKYSNIEHYISIQ